MSLSLKLADRLIARHLLIGIALTALVFVGLDVISALGNEFDEVGKGNYTAGAALSYVGLTIPRRIHEHFATIAVIGTLLGLGGLAPTGELTALRAAGLSKWRIAKSAMGTVLVLVALVLLMGETIAPAAEARAQNMISGLRSANAIATGPTGLWAREGESLLNAKSGKVVGEQLQIDDVRIFDFTPEGRLLRITRARHGVHDGARWRLSEIRRFVFEAEQVRSESAEQELWKSQLDPKLLSLSLLKPAYLSSANLLRKIDYLKRNQLDATAYEASLWSRVFYPINAILLTLAVVPFVFGTLRSGGFGKRLFLGIVVAIGYYFFSRGFVNAASAFHFDHRIALALPLIPLAVWALVYFRRAM